jgi:hypothetical protein
MSVMDAMFNLNKRLSVNTLPTGPPPNISNYNNYEQPLRTNMPMSMQMSMPMMMMPSVEVPPNSPKHYDDKSSTESELQRQIEQYKRELEGVEDDLVYNNDDISEERIYLEKESTNDSDGSSVLKVDGEIDTVELENAGSELEEVSQSNELKENEKREVNTQDEKLMDHMNELENPSSQKDELMEKIINQDVKIESVEGEIESILTNDNEQELKIILKKYSWDELKDLCKNYSLLLKGTKKDLGKRLLACKEFREEIMLKGEL